MICSLDHSLPTNKPEDWWIERATVGWPLILMARGKPPANAPCRKATICLQPFADSMRCVLLATPDASAGKSFVPAQRSARPTGIDFIGSFGNRGNGQYRVELRQGLSAIMRYLTAHQFDCS